MKKEVNDKLQAEKINKLDTLSAGIVFGKEEAWEKLQARLDKKPGIRIPFSYRMAAAVAILMVVAGVMHYRPAHETVTAVTPPVPVKEQAPVMTKEEIQPEAATVQPPAPPVKTTAAKVHKAVAEKQVQITGAYQAVIPDITPEEQETTIAIVPAPVAPSPKPMKTVHINDLYSNTGTEPVIAAAAGRSTDIAVSRLPVVHISEVIHEEYEERRIRKESWLNFAYQSFMQRNYNESHIPEGQPQLPYNELKIRFNSQN